MAQKGELHHDEIQNILKHVPEFEQRRAKLLIHLDLTKSVTDAMNNDTFNAMELIELEQSIISGVNSNGQPVSENNIAKDLTKMVKTLQRSEDIVRLLIIYLNCYALPDKDLKTIYKLVKTDQDREIL